MVNMNQTGEAAGVASVLAIQGHQSVQNLDTQEIRKALSDGGSVVI